MFPARIVRLVSPDPDQPPAHETFHIDGDLAGTRRRMGRFPTYEAAVSVAETAGLDLLYGWTDEIGLNPTMESV